MHMYSDVIDETQDPSNYEESEVAELLGLLSKRYRSLNDVSEQSPTVMKLLQYTSCNSWKAFQQEYSEEIAEFFTEKPQTKTVEPIEDVRLKYCEALHEKVLTQYNTICANVSKLEEQIKNLDSAKQHADIVVLETQGLTWDEKAMERLQAAEKTIAAYNVQHPVLNKQLQSQLRKRSELFHEVTLAKARVTAAKSSDMIIVNTGVALTDAEICAGIARSVCWKIANLSNAINTIRERLKPDTAALFSINNMFRNDSTDGGVYESESDRLDRLETAMDLAYTVYAACEYGFRFALESRDIDENTSWIPEFPKLVSAVREAQQRAALSKLKRAQQMAAGLGAMAGLHNLT